MFRVAVDVQLFQTLDQSESLDIDEIAKATGVTSELLGKWPYCNIIIQAEKLIPTGVVFYSKNPSVSGITERYRRNPERPIHSQQDYTIFC